MKSKESGDFVCSLPLEMRSGRSEFVLTATSEDALLAVRIVGSWSGKASLRCTITTDITKWYGGQVMKLKMFRELQRLARLVLGGESLCLEAIIGTNPPLVMNSPNAAMQQKNFLNPLRVVELIGWARELASYLKVDPALSLDPSGGVAEEIEQLHTLLSSGRLVMPASGFTFEGVLDRDDAKGMVDQLDAGRGTGPITLSDVKYPFRFIGSEYELGPLEIDVMASRLDNEAELRHAVSRGDADIRLRCGCSAETQLLFRLPEEHKRLPSVAEGSPAGLR